MICCLVTLPGSEATGATGRDRGLWVVSWHFCALLSSLLVLTFHSDPVDFLAHLAADTSRFMGHGYFFFFKSILGMSSLPRYPSLSQLYKLCLSKWLFFDEFGQIGEIGIFLLHSLDMELLNHASISKIKSRCAVKETCRCFF